MSSLFYVHQPLAGNNLFEKLGGRGDWKAKRQPTLNLMDGFSSAEEAWLSSITETLRTWRYVMQETYESAADNKED